MTVRHVGVAVEEGVQADEGAPAGEEVVVGGEVRVGGGAAADDSCTRYRNLAYWRSQPVITSVYD